MKIAILCSRCALVDGKNSRGYLVLLALPGQRVTDRRRREYENFVAEIAALFSCVFVCVRKEEKVWVFIDLWLIPQVWEGVFQHQRRYFTRRRTGQWSQPVISSSQTNSLGDISAIERALRVSERCIATRCMIWRVLPIDRRVPQIVGMFMQAPNKLSSFRFHTSRYHDFLVLDAVTSVAQDLHASFSTHYLALST